MADTTFVDNSPPPVDASWLNDVNLTEYYLLGNAGTPPATRADIVANLGLSPGGSYLLSANNLSDVADVPTARTNLGLGALALLGSPLGLADGGTGGTDATTARAALGLGDIAVLNSPLPVADGGTGQSSYTNGQLLIGNTSGNTLAKATLTAGTNVTITNGAGTITIGAAAAGTGTTYSPAIFLDLNISSSSFSEAQYIRVGNTVTVSGSVTVTITAGTSDIGIGIALPFPSAFAALWQCAGIITAFQNSASGGINAFPYFTGCISANIAGARAQAFMYWGGTSGTKDFNYQFTYTVI